MKHTKGGFTLIELLLVIVIIAVLIAFIGPMGQMLFRRADDIACQKHLASVSQAYMAYVHDNRIFPPFIDHTEFLPTGLYDHRVIFPQFNYVIVNNGSFRGGFGPLVWHDKIPVETLICPRDKDRDRFDGPEGWWKANGGNPLHYKRQVESSANPPQATIFSSYSLRAFLHPWTPGTVEGGVHVALAVASFGDAGVQAIMACRIGPVPEVLGRHERGAPVAYLDGSVVFRTDQVLWDDSINKMTASPTGATNRRIIMEIWQALDQR